MLVFDKEYKFKYTPYSQNLIAQHCPDEKAKNIIKTLVEKAEKGGNDFYEFMGIMAESLSKGFVVSELFLAGKPLSDLENSDYFRKETVLHMNISDLVDLQVELLSIITGQSKQSVEAIVEKKTGKTAELN